MEYAQSSIFGWHCFTSDCQKRQVILNKALAIFRAYPKRKETEKFGKLGQVLQRFAKNRKAPQKFSTFRQLSCFLCYVPYITNVMVYISFAATRHRRRVVSHHSIVKEPRDIS